MASRFIIGVEPRDADAPGFYDLRLDTGALMRKFRGEPCIDRLCRKLDMSQTEVFSHLTPGAHVDRKTGEVGLNAGYDPNSDEGRLELLIWATVSREAHGLLTDCNPKKGIKP